jgi:hypothetical protein
MQIDQQIAMENQSQDPRWVNPTILSNEQMVMQTNAMMQQPAPGADLSPGTEGSPGPSEEAKKMEDVRKAQIIVKQMKDLGKENRTDKDNQKYKAAVQVLAKNKDLATKVAGTAGIQDDKGGQ